MIITKTPFRISFLGGGSDIEDFYSQSPGAVLSVTIDKFMYISSHKFFHEDGIRVKYSKTETVRSPEELKHPIVREALKRFNINGALELSSIADVPEGTGLGSSSSFTVGIVHNLYVRAGKYATKEQLACDACDIEINKLREPIGRQDQYAAAYGGLNQFTFEKDGRVSVERLHLEEKTYRQLEDSLLLFFTGRTRDASKVLSAQKEGMKSADKVATLKKMVGLVGKGREHLFARELDQFGRVLHESWVLKRALASAISDESLDGIYEKALNAGALGGKILGAGGGGFLLLYCPAARQAAVRKAMADYRELRIRFEDEGSKLIYVGDEYA